MAGYGRSQAAAATSTFAAGAVCRDGGHILQGSQAQHSTAPSNQVAVSLVSGRYFSGSSMRPIFIPERAKARRALCAPGPGLGVEIRAGRSPPATSNLKEDPPFLRTLLRTGLRATRCPELDVERTDASKHTASTPDLVSQRAPLPGGAPILQITAMWPSSLHRAATS